MNRYDYINKEWIVSPKARNVYRLTAAISLTLFVSVTAAVVQQPVPFLRQLVFVGVVGTAVTLVGMEFFLFRFDNSHPLKQIFWFCLMLLIPLGPALYCFFVYSRSDLNRIERTPSADGISELNNSKPIQ